MQQTRQELEEQMKVVQHRIDRIGVQFIAAQDQYRCLVREWAAIMVQENPDLTVPKSILEFIA